jgi:hypothetical protein
MIILIVITKVVLTLTNGMIHIEKKKHIKEHLDICIETHVTVYRTRRGEWGEWFWVLDDVN